MIERSCCAPCSTNTNALWRYVVRLTGDTALADDVVQETLFRAWRRPRPLDQSEASARSWLFTVARNQGIDRPHTEAVMAASESASASALPRLLAAARRQRRRSRALVAGLVVAAAATAASVALVVPGLVPPEGQPAPAAVTMAQVVPSPLSARFRLHDESWGTRIDASCSYRRGDSASAERAYEMYVTDREGHAGLVASWLAGPGSTVDPVGTTSLARQDIESVDIRYAPTGQVLLESRLEQ